MKLQEAKVYCFPEFADEIAAIELKFQYLSYVISVLEDSDEIELAKYSDLSALNESDAKLIFYKCVGHELAWCWSIVNNQGYSDALKFRFQNNVAFELVVMAPAVNRKFVKTMPFMTGIIERQFSSFIFIDECIKVTQNLTSNLTHKCRRTGLSDLLFLAQIRP